MFGIGLSTVTKALGGFVGTWAFKVAAVAVLALGLYGTGYVRGRLVEARLTGAEFTQAQLAVKEAEIATVRAEAAHNAKVAEEAHAQLEDIDERYRLLARTLDRRGTCDPLTGDELRAFNQVLGHAADDPGAAAGGADTGSRPAASVGARKWIGECARRYSRAREQLRGLRAWIRKHPALTGAAP